MKFFKKGIAAALSAGVLLSMNITFASAEESKGIVILHVNDVHCGINADDNTYGYAELAAYEAKLQSEGYTTLLIDAGDFAQGDVIGTLSDGGYIVDIMNELDFDLATLGNHEFDYGMEQLLALIEQADFDIVSSNFVDLETGNSVYDGWKIIEADGKKLGFVGISTPETVTKSDPTNFKNADGEFIYGFCSGNDGEDLYSNVQVSVDAAKAAGADTIIAVGHLGIDEQSRPWTSKEVIANTTGIDLFIDAHSHSVIDNETVYNENGEAVILTSTGTKLANIGTVTISGGSVTAKLVKKGDYTVSEDVSSAENKAYVKASSFIDGIEAEYNELINTVVARTDVDLTTMNPDNPEERFVRHRETNLGDLCADAYRVVMDADVAFANGGGIRADIEQGDITYGDIIAVHPFGNMMCLAEVTGQDILDALELGSCFSPGESGGFLQVSGLTYEIHNYIPSSVVLTENNEFIGVDGEYRVKNVMVGGEPLDLNKTYTLASHNYMLKSGGDGYTMFKDSTLLKDEILIDNQLLINYIVDELGGVVGEEYANPLGEGRITVYSKAPAEQNEEAYETIEIIVEPDDTTGLTEEADEITNISSDHDKANPDTGFGSITVVVLAAVIAGGAMAISKRRS